jgi:predicted DsbA family dithiol-disulfide isomerase
VSLDLHWQPFQLDPTLSIEGTDKLQHYIKKFGPSARSWLVDPNNRLNERGRPMGLEFVYHEGSKVFNSRPAHRLLHFARSRFGTEMQNKLQEVLFRRYFNQGVNLGPTEALVDAAQEVALPIEQVRQYLVSKEDDDVIDAALRKSRESCDGVPFFVFPSGGCISGGESISTFMSVLQKEAQLLARK